MKIAMLAPVAWRTPPRKYGPWEQVTSNITEGLLNKGLDVTLFATADSITRGTLKSICSSAWEEDNSLDPKVQECMHISYLMEHADEYDIIHNHFDFLPLTYSRLINTPMLTTIHGFSSPKIIQVYQRYNDICHYVSISYADRSDKLNYIANIYNGIDSDNFTFRSLHGDYLLFFGRIHPDKGTSQAISIALQSEMKLIIAGFIQDENYYRKHILPYIDGEQIVYTGNVGPQERDKLLGSAYALLHPISFNEPFGLSVAESMFCGTPVIAFDLGSMPELIEDGKTGFLVQSVDEAVDVLPSVTNLSRQLCRERALNKFSMQKMTDSYYDVYQKILGT
ncbi:MAG TPA: glycosyltransferase family 4 protein [Bacteroidales bacterium]|nr:glycosyltransferase family 4 protein [Bacteroidales bacterium]